MSTKFAILLQQDKWWGRVIRSVTLTHFSRSEVKLYAFYLPMGKSKYQNYSPSPETLYNTNRWLWTFLSNSGQNYTFHFWSISKKILKLWSWNLVIYIFVECAEKWATLIYFARSQRTNCTIAFLWNSQFVHVLWNWEWILYWRLLHVGILCSLLTHIQTSRLYIMHLCLFQAVYLYSTCNGSITYIFRLSLVHFIFFLDYQKSLVCRRFWNRPAVPNLQNYG